MKKIILFFLGIILSNAIKAQTAALTIDNSANPCTIVAKMTATDGNCGIIACGMISNKFLVGPFSTVTFTDFVDFSLKVGWDSWVGGVHPLNCGSGSTLFQWTDIEFDIINCQSISCGIPTTMPGYMSDNATNPGGALVSCSGAGPLWSSFTPGCINNGSWLPAAGVFMSNVTITFW